MSEAHDDKLQVEAAQGDPSRFADLYEQNFYRVYAFIARRVGDRHQAEDLTSDVFREALAGIGKFEWRGVPFAAWLMGIACESLRTIGSGQAARLAMRHPQPVRPTLKWNAAPCCSSWWTGFRRRSSG